MLKTWKEQPEKSFQNWKPSFYPVQFSLHLQQLTMSQLTVVLLLLHAFSVEISWLSFNQNVQQTNEACVNTSSSLLNAKWTQPFCLLSKIPVTSPRLVSLELGVCGDGDLSCCRGCLNPDPALLMELLEAQLSHKQDSAAPSAPVTVLVLIVRKWAAFFTLFLEDSNTPLKKVEYRPPLHFISHVLLLWVWGRV